MIEAFEHPPLHARLIRRGSAFGLQLPSPREETVDARSLIGASDLRFFVGAYLGALTFFLAWLS